MGFAIAFLPCLVCKQVKGFNPVKCPSITVSGSREPVCGECMDAINEKREEMNLEPLPVHPEAYMECDESELGE